jgi:hypothetical protein
MLVLMSLFLGVAGGLMHCIVLPGPLRLQWSQDLILLCVALARNPGGHSHLPWLQPLHESALYDDSHVAPCPRTVPIVEWLCPGCVPLFGNLADLCDPNPILQYSSCDPCLQRFAVGVCAQQFT